MAVRTLRSVPRKLAAFCLVLFLGQSASVPLLAGSGGRTRTPARAKGSAVSEQTLTAQEPARLEGADEDDDAARGPAADDDAVRPATDADVAPWITGPPRELHLQRAQSWNGDLRSLPQTRPVKRERPEREGPGFAPRMLPGGLTAEPGSETPSVPTLNAPAPGPTVNFDGLDFANWGAGHPPDTNGDVGPVYYIETINTSVGIFRKSDQVRVAAFTFNTFMSQGNFGNICDTQNFGDPVVVYDTFEDRWMITDFAFQLDGGGNVIPPALQCLAVSKTGDPVGGGWNFYSIETLGGLGDYPKFGVWPDGIYMSANMFGYASGAAFQGARVWAFNKAQMYAGAPTVQVVTFDAPPADFALLPGNARLQTGTPPAGTPNYYVSSWQFLNALTVYKFHVDWQHLSLSTFTGPDIPIAATSWPNVAPANAPSLGGNNLDVLAIRAMMQAQYSNIGGAESLWTTHTVRRGDTSGFAAPRWYQVNVTGGTVAPTIPQAATWDPDGANVIHRFMPSLAINRNGDLALGYSTSSSTTKPALKYAGRLAADPINTFSQTEQLLVQGTGTQLGNCGSSACTRWGDYSAMTLDPDGCTFWYTNEYYAVDGLNHQTRVGAFALPGCTPVGAGGTLTGTVTDSATTNPLAGATVALGSRTTTTDGSGVYSFTVPAGTYPSLTVQLAAYASGTATTITIADGGTTTRDFALTAAPTSGCFVDSAQIEFQSGVLTNCDPNTTPGDLTLAKPDIDQQNTTLGNQGAGFNTTTWLGQTFTAGATSPVTRVDLNLFSLNCGAVTMPNLTVSIRNAAGNLPTGADLATATIPGFCNGGGAFFTATFASPPTITAGTQYAIVWRAASAIPPGAPAPGYFGTVSAGTGTVAVQNPYAGGRRASSTTSGATWAGAAGNANNDHGFKVFVSQGAYPSSGTLVSSLKDANPVPGAVPHWSTLSWTADTPANTNLQFQAAASNNAGGPFTFVGPDGTAATFYTSGGSLAQFNGKRYLRYRATLSTSSSTATPTLHDVTACFQDLVPTTTAITSDLPDPSVYSGPVAVTYTVSPSAASPSTPTGNVFVTDGVDSCTGTVLSGGCSLTLHTLGLRTLVATYQGDGNFEASPASAGEPHTVVKADATAAITADLTDPSVVGQSVAISYSVAANSPSVGTPTGTVTITDGVNNCIGTLPATSCSITLTTPGSRNLTATYNGDTNFNASPASAVEPHSVAKADTTAAITADPTDPSLTGQSVSVSYSVSVNAPGSGTPTGTVTVTDGVSSCIGTLPTLSCSLTLTGVGAHSLTATYNGDAAFNASPASAVEPHTVGKANTMAAITLDPTDPSVVGQPISVSYSVSVTGPGSGTPTGMVTVGDGVDTCSGTVAAGSCMITLSTAGSRPLTATYGGDANFNASPASAAEPHTVSKASTTAAITSDLPDPSVVGQAVTAAYTITVTSPGSGTPTGTVTVTDGVDTCTGTLPATSCSIALTTLGARSLTATYNGDANFNASPASTVEPHTVSQAATTTTITADPPDPSPTGQPVSVTYSVAVNAPGSGTPTGNVTVSDGVDSCTATVAAGGCAVNLTTAGTRMLVATYAGDASFASSASAPESHVVIGANNLAAGAKDVSIGSVSADVLGSAPDDHNWFRYGVQAGRSYCVEVDNGKTDTSIIDPVLSVYHADGTTSIGTNDNIADEPGGPLLSRVCYIASATEENLADVTSALGGGPGGFRVRVVDTSLFSPWFATGNSFESFILIKNTSGAAYNVTVTLVDGSGAPLAAPQSAVVPANGSYNLQISAPSPGGFGVSTAAGSVLIVHDGPPGALISSVASISFTTGVSFDTPSSPRQEFRR